MFRAQQKRVVTPGQNAKHYLAGVLHAGNGRVLYVSGIKKNSSLFIAMLEKLRRHYRRAKTITLILDNYIIHKSKQTERWLKKNSKFCLVFQPVYSPWVKEGANKRGNSSRLTQSFHFFMFEPIFSPVNALNQPI